MKIFLIGYMACGKSTVGRRLARRLQLPFTDTDHEVEATAGGSIARLFEERGEEYFRQVERRTLDTILARPGDEVVATGGGTPCHGDNLQRMNRAGVSVYLRIRPETLVERLGRGSGRRPLLQGLEGEALERYVRESLAAREAVYRGASLVIDCEGRADEYVARHIAEYVEHHRGMP